MNKQVFAIEPELEARSAKVADEFQRRIAAEAPGTCPIATQLSLLNTSMLQTCGKCVPCRDGLPKLASMLEDFLAYQADSSTLAAAKELAQSIRDTADCAIGWYAAENVLQGLELFADEYESHIYGGECSPGIHQSVPCETLCPAHVDVPSYLAYAREGEFDKAIKVIRQDNPFPTACAYVCEHPCEKHCRRTLIDAPVNIRGIKKYVVDNLAADKVPTPAPLPATGRRIAVIGGGPSGLACAYFLALMGHKVELFESRKQLGGMMRYGIPAYRLPREKLDEDIRAILNAGDITVHYESKVDAHELQKVASSFDAIYVAIGAQGGKTLELEGSDAQGVISAVDLLTQIGDDEYPDFTGKNVVVIGGGNVAMDCARTSVRAGAKSVTVAYRRRLEDMTANQCEIDSAMQEGVEMMTLQAPVRIEVEEGHCTALICQPQFIGPVKHGRPAPQPASKPEVSIPADIILIAVGQDIMSIDFEEFGMPATRSRLVTDEFLQSEVEDSMAHIFAGGDCQIGPKTVIGAIGAGKVAAINIDRTLGFDRMLENDVDQAPVKPLIRQACGRVNIIERPSAQRGADFAAVEVEMSDEEAQQECGRCLRCDHYGFGITDEGRISYA